MMNNHQRPEDGDRMSTTTEDEPDEKMPAVRREEDVVMAAAPASSATVPDERLAATTVLGMPGEEVAFLVTHWLRHYAEISASKQQSASVSRIAQAGAAVERVGRLSRELADAFQDVGAYGTALQSPLALTEPSSMLRHATYEDVANRWSNVSPRHLEHVLFSATCATASAMHTASKTSPSLPPVVTSLLKRSIEERDSVDQQQIQTCNKTNTPGTATAPLLIDDEAQIKSHNVSAASGNKLTNFEQNATGMSCGLSILQNQALFGTPFQAPSAAPSQGSKIFVSPDSLPQSASTNIGATASRSPAIAYSMVTSSFYDAHNNQATHVGTGGTAIPTLDHNSQQASTQHAYATQLTLPLSSRPVEVLQQAAHSCRKYYDLRSQVLDKKRLLRNLQRDLVKSHQKAEEAELTASKAADALSQSQSKSHAPLHKMHASRQATTRQGPTLQDQEDIFKFLSSSRSEHERVVSHLTRSINDNQTRLVDLERLYEIERTCLQEWAQRLHALRVAFRDTQDYGTVQRGLSLSVPPNIRNSISALSSAANGVDGPGDSASNVAAAAAAAAASASLGGIGFASLTSLRGTGAATAADSSQNPSESSFVAPVRHAAAPVRMRTCGVLPAVLTNRALGLTCRSRASIRTSVESSRRLLLLRRLSHVVTINCHMIYPVYCLRFDKSGRFFASGADDHLVKLFYLGNADSTAVNAGFSGLLEDGVGVVGRPPRCSTMGMGSISRGATLVHTLRGHSGVITDIDVSLDNALVATGSEDGDCRVWGLRDGSPVAVLRGHVGGVTMVSFSLLIPYQLITTAEDGLARIWDLREAALKRYVGMIGKRSDYCAPPTNMPSPSRQLGSSRSISEGVLAAAFASPQDQHDSGTSENEDAEHGPQHGRRERGLDGGDASDQLVLPPLPIRLANNTVSGNAVNASEGADGGPQRRLLGHDTEGASEPSTLSVPPLPPPAPPQRRGSSGSNVAANGGNGSRQDEGNHSTETLDEGVRLLAKLQHGGSFQASSSHLVQQFRGPQGGSSGPGSVTSTRSRRRTVKVLCMSRCPIGGHFATGSDDGTGRIWADGEDEHLWGGDLNGRARGRGLGKDLFVGKGSVATRFGGDTLTTSKPLATLPGHLHAITDIHYSSRGDRLITASQNDGVVRIWGWSKEDLPSKILGLRQIVIRLPPLPSSVCPRSGSARNRRSGGRRSSSSRGAGSGASKESVSCDVAAWTADDLHVITCQSQSVQRTIPGSGTRGPGEFVENSHIIRIWDSLRGSCLLSIVGAHSAPSQVVIPHPVDPAIFMTAGADGWCHLWDALTGQKHFSYKNCLHHGAILDPAARGSSRAFLDGAWAPNGTCAILTDDCGRLLLFDAMSPSLSENQKQNRGAVPSSLTPYWMREQYYASDYYELLHDAHGYAIDRRSQSPPHLAPRAVRCTHEGTSIGDSINFILTRLAGPMPLPENLCDDAKEDVKRKSLDVRCKGLALELSVFGTKGNMAFIPPSHGGVVLEYFERIDGGIGTRRQSVGGSNATRRAPQRTLSSRYNWREDYEHDDDDEENDNDEEYVEEAAGRTLNESNNVDADDASDPELVNTDSEVSAAGDDGDTYALRSARPTNRRGGHVLGRRAESHTSGRQSPVSDSPDSEHPTRVSARQESRRTIYHEDEDSVCSELEQMVSRNRQPNDANGYNGHFFEDVQRGHFWRIPANAVVQREWLLRNESVHGRTGTKVYSPQVGDRVVYIPRAHYDTLRETLETAIDSAPWKLFPQNSAWPVVLCSVLNVRYRFPMKQVYRSDRAGGGRSRDVGSRGDKKFRSVVAIVTLEVVGIPQMRSDPAFPWPMADFTMLRETRSGHPKFDVSLFQSGQVDFIIPERLYLWRQRELEAAIRKKNGNPKGIELVVFYDEGKHVPDAPLARHRCNIVSISESDDFESEPHFQQSGYNSIKVRWRKGNDMGDVCLWEVNVGRNETPPSPPTLSASEKDQLLDLISDLEDDEQIKSWFSAPVDSDRYYDYSMMIEVPMDLTKISGRIRENYYSDVRSVLADMRLIKENCCKYNEEDSDIVGVAVRMYHEFETALKEMMKSSEEEDKRGRQDSSRRVQRSESGISEEDSKMPARASPTSNLANENKRASRNLSRGAPSPATSLLERLPNSRGTVQHAETKKLDEDGKGIKGCPQRVDDDKEDTRASTVRESDKEELGDSNGEEDEELDVDSSNDEEDVDDDAGSFEEEEDDNQESESSADEKDKHPKLKRTTRAVSLPEESFDSKSRLRSTRASVRLTVRSQAKGREESSSEDEPADDESSEEEEQSESYPEESEEDREEDKNGSDGDEQVRTRSSSRIAKKSLGFKEKGPSEARLEKASGANIKESLGKRKNSGRLKVNLSMRGRGLAAHKPSASASSESDEDIGDTPPRRKRTKKMPRAKNVESETHGQRALRGRSKCDYTEKDSSEFEASYSSEDSDDTEKDKSNVKASFSRGRGRPRASSATATDRTPRAGAKNGRKRARTEVSEESSSDENDSDSDSDDSDSDVPEDVANALPRNFRWPDLEKKSKILSVAKAIMHDVKALDSRQLFHNPVLESFPQLNDAYKRKIKRPMDFRTIERNIRTYTSLSELQADIELTLQNCCVFNGVDDEYGRYAIMLWNQLPDVVIRACDSLEVNISLP